MRDDLQQKGWHEINAVLRKEFKFHDFTQAFGFLTQVAILAEKQNHHPQIENLYNRVTISLTTHDAGNTVTEKDYKLANAIQKIME